MNTNSLVTAAAVLAISAISASAQVWVSGDSTGSAVPNNLTVGYEFTTTIPLQIVNASAFDAGADGLKGTVQVRIWAETSPGVWGPIGSRDVESGAPLVPSPYRWIAVNVPLPPGHYIVSAWYTNPLDTYGDTGLGDGGPTFASITGLTLGATLIASAPGDTRPDTVYLNGIKGPNLNIAVPEPETYALIAGLGLLGFGLYRRNQARG